MQPKPGFGRFHSLDGHWKLALTRFEKLLRPHFKALHASARRMTLCPADAEDLVQDVCLKAFARMEELEEIEQPRAWLLKILYHQFIDAQRASQRNPLQLADTGMESEDPDLSVSGKWHTEQAVDRDIRAARILRAMECLSGDQCTLVALRDVEGLTIEELRQLTGLPAGTIKAQLHRTRAKLGRLLCSDAIQKPHLQVIGN